jgi:sugar phosphate isomerase/epimerase
MYTSLSCSAIGIKTDLAGALALARQSGFPAVEFSITEAADLARQQGVDAVRQMFATAGVRPGGFGFPVEFRKDEATWRAGLQALPDLAKLAVALGVQRTATWLLPASDERTFAANFRWHVERLRPAAQILADHGIRLGLEFVGAATMRVGKRYSFVHSQDGLLALCAAIGGDNLGLLLDAYHWHTSHGNLDDLAKLSNADVVVVHVNDALAGVSTDSLPDTTRALPCETGVIDLAGFMHALVGMAFDGPVIVEPFSQRLREMSPPDAAHATAAALQQLWRTAGLTA